MTVDKVKLKARAEQLMSEHSGAEFDPIPAIPVAASDVLALLAEIDQLKGIQPGFPPRPPEDEGLPRYGLRWNGPQQPLATPMDDGYWTPWHLADELRKDAERYRWLRENHILAHVQVTQRDGTEPYVYAEELDRSVDDILAAIADKKTGD